MRTDAAFDLLGISRTADIMQEPPHRFVAILRKGETARITFDYQSSIAFMMDFDSISFMLTAGPNGLKVIEPEDTELFQFISKAGATYPDESLEFAVRDSGNLMLIDDDGVKSVAIYKPVYEKFDGLFLSTPETRRQNDTLVEAAENIKALGALADKNKDTGSIPTGAEIAETLTKEKNDEIKLANRMKHVTADAEQVMAALGKKYGSNEPALSVATPEEAEEEIKAILSPTPSKMPENKPPTEPRRKPFSLEEMVNGTK